MLAFSPEQPRQFQNKSYTGIGVAVLLHLVLGYALITGLATNVVKVMTKPIETRIIEEAKPVPPPPAVKSVPPPRPHIKPPLAYVPPPEVHVAAPPPSNAIAAVSDAKPVPAEPVAPPAPPVAKVGIACPGSTAIRQSVEYPREALRDNITGNVLVQFVVGSDGHTRDFTLLRQAHAVLNRAALDAAHRFSCVGQGRDVVVQVPFDFKLE
ncbi:MAG TPA: TonB family protein [Oxalicibacterium sp.]|jgi:protein TonB|nr:TonB family protein [Oxalicibacterium sp.]